MINTEEFWQKVDRRAPDECWRWTGNRDRDGYGRHWRGNGHRMAHRTAHELEIGPIPAGHVVMHRCDSPGCVNPAHLQAGTQKRNVADRDAKGRTARGSRNGCAKLTEEQVVAVRQEVGAGISQREVARRNGVDSSVIWDIVHGRTWRHVVEG